MLRLFIIILVILLVPVAVMAAVPTPGELMVQIMAQPWYKSVVELIGVMSLVSASMPARYKTKADGTPRTWYAWAYALVEFLASNIFHAKTTDKP